VVVFADHARDDGFSVDRSQFGHIPDGLRFGVWGSLVPRLVRPVPVVVDTGKISDHWRRFTSRDNAASQSRSA
jgi:hypothetical protein